MVILLFYRYEVKAVRGAFNRMTYELIIEEVKESDFGVYSCRVKNSEGESFKDIELRSKYKYYFHDSSWVCFICSVKPNVKNILVFQQVPNTMW